MILEFEVPSNITDSVEAQAGRALCARVFRVYANGRIYSILSEENPADALDRLFRRMGAQIREYEIETEYQGGW